MVGKALGVVGGAALGATCFGGRATVVGLQKVHLKVVGFEQRITDAKGLNKWQLMVQPECILKRLVRTV